MFKMTGLMKVLGIYFIMILVFLVVILQLDNTHWNGIKKKNDISLYDRILNRFYFLTTTFSSAGYGDITPKTRLAKLIIIIMQIIMLIGIIDGFTTLRLDL